MKRLKKLNHDDPKLIHHIKSVLVKPASKDSHLQLEGCELLEVFEIIWKTNSRVFTRKELRRGMVNFGKPRTFDFLAK